MKCKHSKLESNDKKKWKCTKCNRVVKIKDWLNQNGFYDGVTTINAIEPKVFGGLNIEV